MSMKSKFVALVKQYNKISKAEHTSYMKRGCGGRYDWYRDDVRDKFDKKFNKINIEFFHIFYDLIPKENHKDFNLGIYDTDDPYELYDAMILGDNNE